MTLDEVIHECEHLSDEFDYENMNGNMAYSTYSDFKDSISKIQKRLKENRWIPVSERLPTKENAKSNRNGYVLVYRKDSAWDVDMCKWHNVEHNELATHWMPLPEPPEQEV